MALLTLIKIGGSLVTRDQEYRGGKLGHDNLADQGCGPGRLNQDSALRRLGEEIGHLAFAHRLAIIPGGGPFADTVREYGKRLGLSQESCHFMALLAMDQYGYVLKESIPGSRLEVLGTTTLDRVAKEMASGFPASPAIWLCSQLVSRIPAHELPRSWAVTSDSLAAYLARKMKAGLLVLVKSTDVALPLGEPDVDTFFSKLLPLPCPTWIINGHQLGRLTQLLTAGKTTGVMIPAGQTMPVLEHA